MHFSNLVGARMFLLIFLISYVGIRFIIRNNRLFFDSVGVSEKKLSTSAVFFSGFVSFYAVFFSCSPKLVWIVIAIVIFLSPLLEVTLKLHRQARLPENCLSTLDQIILILKAGSSLRQSLEQVEHSETGWYLIFVREIKKSLDLKLAPQTESAWFNSFAAELLEIHLSRVKTVDQIQALRQFLRSEIHFKKKRTQVLSGPRFQTFFMGILFLILNGMFFFKSKVENLTFILGLSWFLFVIGLVLTVFIVRSQKWKV